MSRRQAKRDSIDSNTFSDICFWMIVAAFLGAKLFYLLVEWRHFLENPLVLIRSGFIFYGGAIFGFSALYLLSRKYRISFLRLADIIAIGLPLGHALGRLGCFSYGCCYGKLASFWGLERVPTQLISFLALMIIFAILFLLRKRKKFNGQIFLSYLLVYGIFRFVIEFFRGDPRGQIGFLSTSQVIAFGSVLISGWLLYRFWLGSLKCRENKV